MDTSQTILVVDDNATNIVMLSKPLREAGYVVLSAGDGFEAVTIATEQSPDLILLDMVMPKRDGLEVCRLLKSQEATASIPIIFVTGESESIRIVQALNAGGSDYTTKPFRIAEVLARVSVHLQLRLAEKEATERNALLERMAAQLAENNVKLAQQNRIDSLTQILNRGAWEGSAQMEHERSHRCGHTYCVVMIDVDHFKSFNDTQGHAAGDECLRQIANAVASACRSMDLVGRYGGEEFVLLLPETDLEGGAKLAERAREAIWQLAIPHTKSPAEGRVTASFGIATSRSGSLEDVMRDADSALYTAKKTGRNRVHSKEWTSAAVGVAAVPEERARVAKSGSACVLIVDDNATNRALCRGCLKRAGYRTLEAADGQSALSEVRKESPDVVIMDVMMPGMDGLECTRRIKADPATQDVSVIMVSARADTNDILAGLEAGAEEYLTKPIRTEELTLRVRSMVRLRREHRSLIQSYEIRGEQARILALALDFCQSLGAANELDEVLERIVTVTSGMSGCRRVSIMLPDTDRRLLHIVKSIGIDEEIAAGVRVPVGEAIAGKVFESGRSTVVNSGRPDEYTHSPDERLVFASVPLFSTPLGTADQVVGVLNVTDRCGRRAFKPNELENINLIAGVAGAAIRSVLSRQARDQALDSIVLALATLAENRDPETGKHLERVTRYCLLLADELRKKEEFKDQIDDGFVHALGRAVPLHDIGKVAIPDHILLKPGKLTSEEMAIMRTHAELGAKTIRSVIARTPGARFLTIAEQIASAHHEWIDGSGYPRGLVGDAIPLSARIAAVADVYDALTTKRPYKDAFSHEKSRAIITGSSATQFDRAVVEAFVARESDFAKLAHEMADELTPEETVLSTMETQEVAQMGVD